jgi:hypothetical protein
MKRITSVLNVETDRVDNTVGTGNGGLHGAFVMCIGRDLFNAIGLGPPTVPRDYAYSGAGFAQVAHDARSKKPSPAKHGYAADFPIRHMVLWDALDRPIKCGAHCLGRVGRGSTPIDMMRNHIDQNLQRGADRLPLLLRLLDQRFGFSVQASRLFDDRLSSIEKIDQRLGGWQRLLNLFNCASPRPETWPTSSKSQCSNIV